MFEKESPVIFDSLRKLDLFKIFQLLVKTPKKLRIEELFSGQHFIQYYSCTPDITRLIILPVSKVNFRSFVQRSTHALGMMAIRVCTLFCQPIIGYFDVLEVIEKDVVRLQVPMHQT